MYCPEESKFRLDRHGPGIPCGRPDSEGKIASFDWIDMDWEYPARRPDSGGKRASFDWIDVDWEYPAGRSDSEGKRARFVWIEIFFILLTFKN